MKNLFLTLAALLMIGISASAQVITIVNNTDCDIDVRQVCYDSRCEYVSHTNVFVPAGATVQIDPCPTNYIAYDVAFHQNCYPDPYTSAHIDGSTPPAGCGASNGTYQGTLEGCCGAATATFNPTTGTLTIQ